MLICFNYRDVFGRLKFQLIKVPPRWLEDQRRPGPQRRLHLLPVAEHHVLAHHAGPVHAPTMHPDLVSHESPTWILQERDHSDADRGHQRASGRRLYHRLCVYQATILPQGLCDQPALEIEGTEEQKVLLLLICEKTARV